VTSSEGEEHRERIAESAVCPKKTLPEAWQYLHTREAASSKEGKKKREGERMRDKSYYHAGEDCALLENCTDEPQRHEIISHKTHV
jgi:hypothetical protein